MLYKQTLLELSPRLVHWFNFCVLIFLGELLVVGNERGVFAGYKAWKAADDSLCLRALKGIGGLFFDVEHPVENADFVDDWKSRAGGFTACRVKVPGCNASGGRIARISRNSERVG